VAQFQHCLVRWFDFYRVTAWQHVRQGSQHPHWGIAISILALPLFHMPCAALLAVHRRIWPKGQAGLLLLLLHITCTILAATYAFGLPCVINSVNGLNSGLGLGTLGITYVYRLSTSLTGKLACFIILKVGGWG
jgi:hypothetical protein